jgi:putative radical SAM enzyme (TIGR03279 family)
VKVRSVEAGSEAETAGVAPGDDLVTIAGMPVRDSLDLAYALGWIEGDADEAAFEFVRGGDGFTLTLPPQHPEGLGMELEADVYRTCPNRCVFCFVDQLPGGLRAGLSVKDEDFRLSFAFGNYITLTNLTSADYARIGEQRLSPLYVSVHATDDSVRRRMLGNPDAPAVMDSLRRLRDLGIEVHAQIVVVPGTNDGPVLERSLDDLAALECVRSVAVVPVGLTLHRKGLPEVSPVTPELARRIIDAVEDRQRRLLAARGSRTVFAADELYLAAGRKLPPFESYEDFDQVENGVGLLRAFERDFLERVPDLRGRVDQPLTVDIVTGVSAAPFLRAIVPPGLASVAPIVARVAEAVNDLFGPTVTVAGLLSGADMTAALEGAADADLTLLPGEAFNADGLTVDGMTAAGIAAVSGCGRAVATRDIIEAILNHLAEGRAPAAGGEETTSR